MKKTLHLLAALLLALPATAAINVNFTYEVVDSEYEETRDEDGFPYPEAHSTIYVVVTGVNAGVTDLTVRSYEDVHRPDNPRWETTYYTSLIVVGIREGAFEGNTTLQSAYVSFTPQKGYDFGSSAFASCSNLRQVHIYTDKIPSDTFWQCANLESVTLGEGMKWIGYQAFYKSGVKSITLPSTIDSIAQRAFEECSQLASFDFNNCKLKETPAMMLSKCHKLQRIVVPEGVETTAPSLVSSDILEYAKVPSTIKKIGMGLLNSKKPITLETSALDPSKITLEFWALNPYGIDNSLLQSSRLIVPPGTKALYQNAAQWKDFGTISEMAYAGNFVGSGFVDVYDLAYFYKRYSGGNAPVSTFDINHDGAVNNNDFTAQMDDINSCVYPETTSYTADMLSVSDFTVSNTNNYNERLTLKLSAGTKKLSAIQFDLKVPDNKTFSIYAVDSNDKVYKTRISNDVYRIIYVPSTSFSTYNTVTGDKQIIRISDNIESSEGAFEFSNIILANESAEYFQRPFSYSIGNKGDINADGNVNTGDVSTLYAAILAGNTDSRFDINGDGNVNTGDVSALYALILAGN